MMPKNGKKFIDKPKKKIGEVMDRKPARIQVVQLQDRNGTLTRLSKEEITLNKGSDIVVLQRTKVH